MIKLTYLTRDLICKKAEVCSNRDNAAFTVVTYKAADCPVTWLWAVLRNEFRISQLWCDVVNVAPGDAVSATKQSRIHCRIQ